MTDILDSPSRGDPEAARAPSPELNAAVPLEIENVKDEFHKIHGVLQVLSYVEPAKLLSQH